MLRLFDATTASTGDTTSTSQVRLSHMPMGEQIATVTLASCNGYIDSDTVCDTHTIQQ